jgi:hypothetical protein
MHTLGHQILCLIFQGLRPKNIQQWSHGAWCLEHGGIKSCSVFLMRPPILTLPKYIHIRLSRTPRSTQGYPRICLSWTHHCLDWHELPKLSWEISGRNRNSLPVPAHSTVPTTKSEYSVLHPRLQWNTIPWRGTLSCTHTHTHTHTHRAATPQRVDRLASKQFHTSVSDTTPHFAPQRAKRP